jgi:hypothetical protein
MSLQSVVQGIVQAGSLTQQQGDEIVAQGGGNFTATADAYLTAGTISKAQRDEIVAAGAGN